MNELPVYHFSIILPVRNGGEYIKECVNSILSQTVSTFNLIILDSGSTDGTVEWIKTLKDSRIIFYPADKPLTIEENWNRIKSIPRNEWMTIIGHDDILAPGYLNIISELINKYPDASLYQTHFNLIDAKGGVLRKCKPMEEKQSAKEFLDKILRNDINVYGTGFMVRSKDYDKAGGIPLYPNLMSADYTLWLELTSISYKATSPVTCFSYRISQSTTATTKDDTYIAALKLFIDYLVKSKNKINPEEDKNSYIKKILSFYCQRVSRRLLLTSKQKRNNFTVSQFIEECKEYARQLMDKGHSFNPAAVPGVRIAQLIDSTELTRELFILVKRIHPNPIL
jgi:glycosyltransferase involved in cell wall biosynthesis